MTTISYSLLPIPKWYFAQFDGKPLGGGFMQAWSMLNPTIPKTVFQDAAGTLAWPTQSITIGQVVFPNAILFDANGEQGPFFWQFDTAHPSDLYLLVFYDAQGNQQFVIENYGAPAGGGGGGTITVNNNLENFINNNVFWRNQGTLSNIQNGTVIAPSNHEGLVKNPAETAFTDKIPFAGPDIMFVRSNDTPTDSISFDTSDFSPGNNPLTNDVTPEFYINAQCSAVGSGNTLKAIQFPVDLHVKNFEGQAMSAIIWAKGVSGTINLTMQFVQYFGTGSATTPVVTSIPISASPLTNGWQAYQASFNVPSTNGKTLGAGGDDASYLQVVFPASNLFQIYFTKPKLYLGAVSQVFPELQTYDRVETIINSPRTGDLRSSFNTFSPFGWVTMNDGTIGNNTPGGSSSNATTRANIDTWPLFNLLWNLPATACPVFTSGGALTTRGANAITDFGNYVAIALPKALGRVMSGANPSALGVQKFITASNSAGNLLLTVDDTTPFYTGTQVTFTNSGGALPGNLVAATQYWLTVVNSTTLLISTSLANALAESPTYVAFLNAGSGTNSFTTTVSAHTLASYTGEDTHALTVAQLPSHDHQASFGANFILSGGSGSGAAGGADKQESSVTAPRGGSTAHNNIQPTTYANYFIKL